jgi:hypothetical protein
MEKIKIMHGDLKSGHLLLSDNGHTNAKRKEIIKWKIGEHSNVTRIESIYVKNNRDNVFSELTKVNDKKWKAEIKADAADYTRCEYAIRWEGPKGQIRTHDPIIAIKPTSTSFNQFVQFALVLLAPILILCSVNLFLKNRK